MHAEIPNPTISDLIAAYELPIADLIFPIGNRK